MEDKTEHVMSTTNWFVDLASDKTAPPMKEFQVQGALKYKKSGDAIEYGVTLGYEIT